MDGDGRWDDLDETANVGAYELGAAPPEQWHAENRWTGLRRPELLFGMSHVAGAVEQMEFLGEEVEADLANLEGADLEFDVANGRIVIGRLGLFGQDGNSSLNTPTEQPIGDGRSSSAITTGIDIVSVNNALDGNLNVVHYGATGTKLAGIFGTSRTITLSGVIEASAGEPTDGRFSSHEYGEFNDFPAEAFLTTGGNFVQTLNSVGADSVAAIINNNNSAMPGAVREFDVVNGQSVVRGSRGRQGGYVQLGALAGEDHAYDLSQFLATGGNRGGGGETYLVYDGDGRIAGARFDHGWYDRLDLELQEDAASSRAHWVPVHESTTPTYAPIPENPFRLVTEAPRSTFSIDVDTASYTNVRQMLNRGMLPPPGAVRIEEFINYFDYDYALPDDDSLFSVDIEVAECPWNADHRLVHIGLQGYDVTEDERPAANLVYLIDVSGSMAAPDRLPLLKQALTMLAVELTGDDSIAIVTYADEAEVVLDATSCYSNGAIMDAIDGLRAGGSTNGGAGLEEAYAIATENFIEGGINRVILATDGGFNIGATTDSDLVRLIEEQAKSGVFLTVLGFGGDSLNDSMLEAIADKGNGHYAFIDSLEEAERLLVDRMGGAVMTIAKDVKIQIEFNPAEVSAYRLIGYENRVMPAQHFNDDTKDAGEIGAGHSVTALYEIIPAGAQDDAPDVDPLVYQTELEPTEAAESGELLTIKLRYKDPDGETSELIEGSVIDEGATFAEASEDFAFAASVAGFAMLLRKSEYAGDLTLEAVLEMAEAAMDYDPVGDRAEFVALVARAIEITRGS
ncbi:MAG: VWA domain-containing protein [Planctomycetes bacterium]|nr:VWA domain-containing protein [Planctomycetota bacterium]